MNTMDNGVHVHGGMIVNAMSVGQSAGNQMATGGTYTMPNMPGGHRRILSHAFYGVEAIGWSSSPMQL